MITRCHSCYFCCLDQVVLWNMDTLQTESTPEEHKSVITDVRFRPNSTQLATASFDQSVKLWDAAIVKYLFFFWFKVPIHVSSIQISSNPNKEFQLLESNIITIMLPFLSLCYVAAKVSFTSVYVAQFTCYVSRLPPKEN